MCICVFTMFIKCTHNIKKTRNMTYKCNFYTQYNQFYLSSDGANSLTSGLDWDEQSYKDRLVVLNNSLVVFTECYGPVKGEISILEKANNVINYDLYDHIVEGGLDVKSGKIQVLDCPNSSVELEIPVKSGKYRIRVYSSNLSSVDGDEGNDYYKIEIWESDSLERTVLKRY